MSPFDLISLSLFFFVSGGADDTRPHAPAGPRPGPPHSMESPLQSGQQQPADQSVPKLHPGQVSADGRTGWAKRLGGGTRRSAPPFVLIRVNVPTGYVCERKDLLVNGCCNVNAPSTRQHICKSCLANGCCSIYEYCVSCCLQPDKVIRRSALRPFLV